MCQYAISAAFQLGMMFGVIVIGIAFWLMDKNQKDPEEEMDNEYNLK